MRTVADFTLSLAKIECPACCHSFTGFAPSAVSSVTADTPFETDLHRLYSSPSCRASGIGMCTHCGYAWWMKAFRLSVISEAQDERESAENLLRKFARAYVCGKQHKHNHLELGLIALNASWCARDGKINHKHWSSIAREELERALRHPSTRKDRGFYQYLLGELYRQESNFKSALKHFDLAVAGERLPESLIARQKVQARSGDPQVTLLPPYLVESLFCPAKSFHAA